jgi:hypothetical protein
MHDGEGRVEKLSGLAESSHKSYRKTFLGINIGMQRLSRFCLAAKSHLTSSTKERFESLQKKLMAVYSWTRQMCNHMFGESDTRSCGC